MYSYSATGNYNVREDFGQKNVKKEGNYLGDIFTKDMVHAIIDINECKKRNDDNSKTNSQNYNNALKEFTKISLECKNNLNNLEKEKQKLNTTFNTSKIIAQKKGATQAQKDQNITDKKNLDAKTTEIKNYNNSCKSKVQEPMNSYSRNLLPSYYGRNLSFKVLAGNRFQETQHICCPNTHKKIGYMKYGILEDLHVCSK